MKNIFFSFATLLLCIGIPVSPAFAAVADNTIDAVVALHTAAKSGTGFFISKDGYILTNEHVIRGSSVVDVCRQADAKSDAVCGLSATVVAENTEIDVALLKVDPDPKFPYPFLMLGTSGSIALDDSIRLLGFPDSGGGSLTVTSGKVSGWLKNGSLIKVDASLSSGSSGGAMINTKEEAIGISQAVITGDFSTSGVVIPIDIVKSWLFTSGFPSVTSFGTNIEALETNRKSLEELLASYQDQSRKQKVAYETIVIEHDKMRSDQKKDYEAVIKSYEVQSRNQKNEIDSYLADVQARYSQATYLAEKRRLDLEWERFLDRIAASKAKTEATYKSNLDIIDQKQAAALEAAGVIDLTPRIAEAHEALEKIKREISKLRLATAQKKVKELGKSSDGTSTANSSAPPENTPSTSGALPTESDVVPYENFGSPQAKLVTANWLLKSIKFTKNNQNFVLFFWKPVNAETIRTAQKAEAVITTSENGSAVTPLIVRKKFFLIKYDQGEAYTVEIRLLNNNNVLLDTLKFETVAR